MRLTSEDGRLVAGPVGRLGGSARSPRGTAWIQHRFLHLLPLQVLEDHRRRAGLAQLGQLVDVLLDPRVNLDRWNLLQNVFLVVVQSFR